MARGVKRMPALVGSHNVTTVEDLRKGLEFKIWDTQCTIYQPTRPNPHLPVNQPRRWPN